MRRAAICLIVCLLTVVLFGINVIHDALQAGNDVMPSAIASSISGGGSSNVDFVLIIDSSGSMETSDPQDLRKEAANGFIDVAQLGDRIAVIDFDSNVDLLQSLTLIDSISDRQDLKTAVGEIDSFGGTDIGEGVEAGFDQLQLGAVGVPKAALLLTDGQSSYSLSSHAPYQQQGWPIFTIGLGSGVEDGLLNQIAKETGGTYTFLDDANGLTINFQDIYQQMSGANPLVNSTVTLSQGQNLDVLSSVPPQQTGATFFISWTGAGGETGDVDLTLLTPSGQTIDSNTNDPNVYHASSNVYETYTVQNPESGEWTMQLEGVLTPLNTDLTVDVRASSQGPSFIYIPAFYNRARPEPVTTAATSTPRPPVPINTPVPTSPPPTNTPAAPNEPPDIPSEPFPNLDDIDVPVTQYLRWRGSDPDGSTTVTFDIYMDANNPNPSTLMCTDIPVRVCFPDEDLLPSTDYYWKVVATDEHGSTSVGDIWKFTTGQSQTGCLVPSQPELTSPADGTTIADDMSARFYWEAILNATTTQLVVYTETGNLSDATGTSPGSLSYRTNGKAYWRVRGIYRSGNCDVDGPWSEEWSLTFETP